MFFFSRPPRDNCRDKRRFNSDADAQAALKLINPSKKNGKPRRAYKCPRCGRYHLTSQKNN